MGILYKHMPLSQMAALMAPQTTTPPRTHALNSGLGHRPSFGQQDSSK